MMDTATCVLKPNLVPLAVLAVGAALSGCGKSDSEAAADTVTTYLKAFGAGDGEEACERLTEETKRDIAFRVAEKFGGSDCPDAIRGLRTRLSAAQADAFEEASATRVRVRGDAADVRFRAGEARGLATLRKAGDEWKISLLPRAR